MKRIGTAAARHDGEADELGEAADAETTHGFPADPPLPRVEAPLRMEYHDVR